MIPAARNNSNHEKPQHGNVPYEAVESGLIAEMTRESADAPVYLAICAHARWNGEAFVARPSMRTLAKATGYKLGTVSRAVERLKQIGAFVIAAGPRGQYLYHLTVQRGPNGGAFSGGRTATVQPTPNGGEGDCSARTSTTVQRGRAERSAPAEQNSKNRYEQAAGRPAVEGGAGGPAADAEAALAWVEHLGPGRLDHCRKAAARELRRSEWRDADPREIPELAVAMWEVAGRPAPAEAEP